MAGSGLSVFVHPFMLHLHTPTAFALAPATKIDLDHIPELLGEMERQGRPCGHGSPCGSNRPVSVEDRRIVSADAASRLGVSIEAVRDTP